jgi:hypothetical protein
MGSNSSPFDVSFANMVDKMDSKPVKHTYEIFSKLQLI